MTESMSCCIHFLRGWHQLGPDHVHHVDDGSNREHGQDDGGHGMEVKTMDGRRTT